LGEEHSLLLHHCLSLGDLGKRGKEEYPSQPVQSTLNVVSVFKVSP